MIQANLNMSYCELILDGRGNLPTACLMLKPTRVGWAVQLVVENKASFLLNNFPSQENAPQM